MRIQKHLFFIAAGLAVSSARPQAQFTPGAAPGFKAETKTLAGPTGEVVDVAGAGFGFGDSSSALIGNPTPETASVFVGPLALVPSSSSKTALGLALGSSLFVNSVDGARIHYVGVDGKPFPPNATTTADFQAVTGFAETYGFCKGLDPFLTAPSLFITDPPLAYITFNLTVVPGTSDEQLRADLVDGLVAIADAQPDGSLTPGGISSYIPLTAETVSIGEPLGRSGNDMPLHNGADALLIFSSPSVGSPAGGVPNINGDLIWKILPRETLTCAGYDFTLDGFNEGFFATDWQTPPDLYDRAITGAVESVGVDPCTGLSGSGIGGSTSREPLFFQNGFQPNDRIISIGNSGLGNPCTIAPSLCSPSGGSCAPSGQVVGYDLEISLSRGEPGSGVKIPCNGECDSAITYFLPGGMTLGGGSCGDGDYVFQTAISDDESQGDPTGDGVSPFGGLQFAGSGPIPLPLNYAFAMSPTFTERLLNVVADTGFGLGPETAGGFFAPESLQDGGATNALNLPIGGGNATLGVEIRSLQDAGGLNLAYAASTFNTIAPDFVSYFAGVFLLLAYPPACVAALGVSCGTLEDKILYDLTLRLWISDGIGIDPTSPTGVPEGQFLSVQIGYVPVSMIGRTLYTQGSVLHYYPGPMTADGTNMVKTLFLP